MKKKTVLLLTVCGLLTTGCTQNSQNTTSQPELTNPQTIITNEEKRGTLMTVDKLLIEDLTVGEGAEATAGAKVSVHYTGTLTDGTHFDSSVDRGAPFSFVLGAGTVIEGWDQGVAGMKVGGKRKLTIPADLAYGEGGAGKVIPPNATLIFEIELLDVN